MGIRHCDWLKLSENLRAHGPCKAGGSRTDSNEITYPLIVLLNFIFRPRLEFLIMCLEDGILSKQVPGMPLLQLYPSGRS
jgi:hypothetical protein